MITHTKKYLIVCDYPSEHAPYLSVWARGRLNFLQSWHNSLGHEDLDDAQTGK